MVILLMYFHPQTGDKFINLFDINGRKVLSTTLVGDMLDISSFSPGFYMIEVSMEIPKKFLKLIDQLSRLKNFVKRV